MLPLAVVYRVDVVDRVVAKLRPHLVYMKPLRRKKAAPSLS